MNFPLIRSSSVCLCDVFMVCSSLAVEFVQQASGLSSVSGMSVASARSGIASSHGAKKRDAKSDCPRLSLHHVRCCSLPNAPDTSWLFMSSCPGWFQYGVTRRFGVGSP